MNALRSKGVETVKKGAEQRKEKNKGSFPQFDLTVKNKNGAEKNTVKMLFLSVFTAFRLTAKWTSRSIWIHLRVNLTISSLFACQKVF